MRAQEAFFRHVERANIRFTSTLRGDQAGLYWFGYASHATQDFGMLRCSKDRMILSGVQTRQDHIMANPTISTSRPSVAANGQGALRTFFDRCGGFIERFNAAINVARSVENRRAPSRCDLDILDIDCDIPRV